MFHAKFSGVGRDGKMEQSRCTGKKPDTSYTEGTEKSPYRIATGKPITRAAGKNPKQ